MGSLITERVAYGVLRTTDTKRNLAAATKLVLTGPAGARGCVPNPFARPAFRTGALASRATRQLRPPLQPSAFSYLADRDPRLGQLADEARAHAVVDAGSPDVEDRYAGARMPFVAGEAIRFAALQSTDD